MPQDCCFGALVLQFLVPIEELVVTGCLPEEQNFGSAIGPGSCCPTHSDISGTSFHVRLINGPTKSEILTKSACEKSRLLRRNIVAVIDMILRLAR